MSINKNELTKEQIAKAMSCETALEDFELDEAMLKNVAGGLQGIQCQTLKY